jgi:Predicted membrane protein
MLENLAIATADAVTRIIELTGIAVIALGAFGTLSVFLYRFASGHDREQAVAALRSSLGRAILLGLEFLVAADIINTVAIEPTLNSVAVLAGIVAIRTFLSFSLEAEIEGRLPWRKARQQEKG